MYVYFLPGSPKQRLLLDSLRGNGLKPLEIDEKFLESDLRLLSRAGHESHAFLLGDSPNLMDQIVRLRKAECGHPVLIMRDAHDAAETASALDAGADDDLTLPVTVDELKARINAVLRRVHGHSAESISIGEITAFFDGRDPEISGRRVKLSKREHMIFHQLVLNARRVVSKASIYDAVYGMVEHPPLDKVIDVYICKIRKKIGDAAESAYQYIETVHGRGYKLEEQDEDMAALGSADHGAYAMRAPAE